ncbi:MAG: ABC transporter ATP-binding protein [Clostridium sp.]|uniref:ABC transporter ATP-binding protein n=1 Tax=Clostridium sp. TaxID=1506 RepID=UPI003021C92F
MKNINDDDKKEVLRVEKLGKSYGQGESVVNALMESDFEITKGEFVAIIGPSGSGKSTLLHLLGGIDKPSCGKVFIDGQDIYDMNSEKLAILRRQKIGFIFQYYNLIPVLNVRENILMPTLLDGNSEDKEYTNELIEILGLKNRETHLPSQLSGGQQQRVAIGRALVNKPSIILADEPTGNLDTKTTTEILNLLKLSVKKYNQTLVVITHDPNIAKQADRIIKIEDGKIISDELVKSIKA